VYVTNYDTYGVKTITSTYISFNFVAVCHLFWAVSSINNLPVCTKQIRNYCF